MAKTKEERYAITEAYSNTLKGRLNKIKINARGSAKKRNNVCNLEYYDIRDLWAKQKGLCAYTGWPMELEAKSQRLVSLERIDNNRGYEVNNILLVCWCANKARSGMTQKEFLTWQKQLAIILNWIEQNQGLSASVSGLSGLSTFFTIFKIFKI